MCRDLIIFGVILVLCWAGSTAGAVELPGVVESVMGERITIKISPDLLPNPGDKVEAFDTIPGLGEVALDCEWAVAEVQGGLVTAVTEDKSRATAQQGYKAVVYSANPRSTRPAPPVEKGKEEPVEEKPVDKEPPSKSKPTGKKEQPPKIEKPPREDDSPALVLPRERPQQQPPEPEGPQPVTAAALYGEEPWVMNWVAHDILVDFPGAGRAGLYREAVPSGEAHPSPGRRGILYVHPAGVSQAAKIGHHFSLQGTASVLKVGVCANREPVGDCLLVLTIDGARWGLPKLIRGADGWQDLTYDLSPFAGRMVTVQFEVHSNNWQHEYAFFDYIRIEDQPEPGGTQAAQGQQNGPTGEGQGVSVLRTVFADDFDGENDGAGQRKHRGFQQWFLRSGEADLLGRGLRDTYPAHGLYVELHGNGYLTGKLQSKRAFRLSPDSYLLQFDVAANPRGGKSDLTVTLGGLYAESFALEGKRPFETVSRRIDVSQPANAALVFQLRRRGTSGPLIDNVRLMAVSYGGSPAGALSGGNRKAPSKSATPYLGVRVGSLPDGSVRLVDVVPDSPAARAGLLPDDVVLQVGDASFEREFVGTQAFVSIVSRLSVDRPAMFIIRRDDKRLAIWVKLEPK
jgi:hypothetical protein